MRPWKRTSERRLQVQRRPGFTPDPRSAETAVDAKVAERAACVVEDRVAPEFRPVDQRVVRRVVGARAPRAGADEVQRLGDNQLATTGPRAHKQNRRRGPERIRSSSGATDRKR